MVRIPFNNKQMRKILILALLPLLFSCGKAPQLPGFDAAKWRGDPMGCKGERKQGAAIILKNRDALQGVSESKLEALLGKADLSVLYERNVTNLIYFTEPGSQCSRNKGKKGRRIVIEFNATGFLTWINEEHI